MAEWTQLLPVFIVRWLAKRYAGRINAGGAALACGPAGAYFQVGVTPPFDSREAQRIVDRALKMMLMAGYGVALHDADHNNPIVAWMADARTFLAHCEYSESKEA